MMRPLSREVTMATNGGIAKRAAGVYIAPGQGHWNYGAACGVTGHSGTPWY
jgi:predicted ATPase